MLAVEPCACVRASARARTTVGHNMSSVIREWHSWVLQEALETPEALESTPVIGENAHMRAFRRNMRIQGVPSEMVK